MRTKLLLGSGLRSAYTSALQPAEAGHLEDNKADNAECTRRMQ
jgi:hypothetical protein